MIKHIKCDIFKSNADVICHQVNCRGVMGAGIAKQIKSMFPKAFTEYERLCSAFKQRPYLLLGRIQWVGDGDGKYIVNMFAQDNYGRDNKCYTDYKALRECLEQVHQNTPREEVIAIPYLLGCGLGGGDWHIVTQIIKEVFQDREILVCEKE